MELIVRMFINTLEVLRLCTTIITIFYLLICYILLCTVINALVSLLRKGGICCVLQPPTGGDSVVLCV